MLVSTAPAIETKESVQHCTQREANPGTFCADFRLFKVPYSTHKHFVHFWRILHLIHFFFLHIWKQTIVKAHSSFVRPQGTWALETSCLLKDKVHMRLEGNSASPSPPSPPLPPSLPSRLLEELELSSCSMGHCMRS